MRLFWAVLICGAAALLVIGTPAAAKNHPVVGGKGQHSIVVGCTAGEYMIGFKGRTGLWIDRIGPVCAPLLPSMELGEKHYPATYGGNGGSPDEHTCGADEVLQGIVADKMPDDAFNLHSVKLFCGSIKSSYQHWIGNPDSGIGGFGTGGNSQIHYPRVLMQDLPKANGRGGLAFATANM